MEQEEIDKIMDFCYSDDNELSQEQQKLLWDLMDEFRDMDAQQARQQPINYDDKKMLFEALMEAKGAFKNYFERLGFDPSFFDVELTGFALNKDFKPQRSLNLPAEWQEDHEFKEVKEND